MRNHLLRFLMTLVPMVAWAYDAKIDGIYYDLNSEQKTATVTYLYYASLSNRSAYIGEVVIPSVITYNDVDYSVIAIGECAFAACTDLTSVTIPNSVTSIGRSAFYGCDLTSITIPKGVTSICQNAFYGCLSLTSITIPNSVTNIGVGAFNFCIGLSSIVVEAGNTIFDSRDNCNAIIATRTDVLIVGCKNTIIPNSVTRIYREAFDGCSELTSITIPNSVTSIGDHAFYGCSGLTSVTIPNSVTSIGDHAFYGCSGLTSVTIPNSVTSIGKMAFSGCSGLTSINVEAGNTIFDSRDNCNAIIETRTDKLIAGCNNTIIPKNVTSIDENAFYGCSELTSITIPNSVTSIGGWAFSGCSGLTSITIPYSVTSIECNAFYKCRNLADFYCYAENTPMIEGDAFYESNIANATLHVPAGSIDSYKMVKPWNSFKEIVALTDSDPGEFKCAKPAIAYVNGELVFSCVTEDVTYCYKITSPSSLESEGNNVKISTKYVVTVHAKKEGYLDSEPATAEIDVKGIKGDVNGDGTVDIADAVRIVNKVVGKIDALSREATIEDNKKEPQ